MQEAVAGRGLDRHGVAHRAAQERPAELLVPLEAATRQDHALRRLDLDRAVRRVDEHADDGTVADQQPAAGARRARQDPAVEAALEQPPGQRLAATALVVELPALVLLGRRRFRHRLAERGLTHRDVRIGEVRRRRHAPGPLAELVERVDRALQRPTTTRAAARELRVVVGHAGHGVELDRRLRLHQLDHVGPGVDVGLHELLLEEPAGQGHDVRDGLVPAVLDADLRHVRVVRDPHLPARPGGRPPDLVGLLEDGDRGAAFVGDDRRRQPGCTGPQHDDVKPFHGPLLPVGVPRPADGTDTGVESQPM